MMLLMDDFGLCFRGSDAKDYSDIRDIHGKIAMAVGSFVARIVGALRCGLGQGGCRDVGG
jgi:hypothetical protein